MSRLVNCCDEEDRELISPQHLKINDLGKNPIWLSHLLQIVDRLVVRKLTVKETGRRARAMVEAMVALARALGMRTVAEGIETETQLVLVKELGCDAAQGYFIGKPVSAARVEPYAETRFGPALAAVYDTAAVVDGPRLSASHRKACIG